MPSNPPARSRPGGNTGSPSYITAAVGLQETEGRQRARRSSLFTQTIVWITGLVCLVFLLGALAQAWSNSQLMQQLQQEQQKTQQIQRYHDQLARDATHYSDPFVIESEARKQLGYVRPGEHGVVVIGQPDQSQAPTTSTPSAVQPQGFWQAWWNVFFGG